MGGMFSAPKPPSMSASESVPDVAKQNEKLRLDAMDRHRRGRAGTIVTSDRGLFTKTDDAPKKKTLLGE
ncbi:MAG: hypothetical protein JKY92_09550 [Magnetovibrio sp.]|nr:hypothetical protein [Magnetovibrio sp.]